MKQQVKLFWLMLVKKYIFYDWTEYLKWKKNTKTDDYRNLKKWIKNKFSIYKKKREKNHSIYAFKTFKQLIAACFLASFSLELPKLGW